MCHCTKSKTKTKTKTLARSGINAAWRTNQSFDVCTGTVGLPRLSQALSKTNEDFSLRFRFCFCLGTLTSYDWTFPLPDVVDVNRNWGVGADPVFLHECNEVWLGEVVRRCRLPFRQSDVFHFQAVTSTKVGNGVGGPTVFLTWWNPGVMKTLSWTHWSVLGQNNHHSNQTTKIFRNTVIH